MGVNGLEAANGWIFSRSSNGDSHNEYKDNFPVRNEMTHKCYMYRLQQAEQPKRVGDYVYCDDVT